MPYYVSYKNITKFIYQRLYCIIETIMGPEQSIFIPKQNIDNTIIGQEVLHSMRKKCDAKCWIEIKINLDVACNGLD